MRDYLGSVRAVYDITQEAEDVTDIASVILEQNDYYAFGGRIEDPTQPIDQENRYMFNGKEQLRFDGIGLDPNLTDYGARYYESRYARWTTPDPLADKYYSTSPYAFCNNNPVNFVDPDGRRWYDKAVGYSVGTLTNIIPGTGFIRDLYSPTDSGDYNSALRNVDNAATVVGSGMTRIGGTGVAAGTAVAMVGAGATVVSGGTAAVAGVPVAAIGVETAILGAKTATAGVILMANSAQNKSVGYERGNTSSGNKNSKHANLDAKISAKAKYEDAKKSYETYKHKQNILPEEKKLRDNYKKQMIHWKKKMDFTGENHNQNAKGNR